MPIQSGDIKILRPQVMLDTDEGGGQMTGIEVIDGQSNNLFPDVSELDRTYGRIAMRKAFAAVLTSNTDSYYGAHVIISRPPTDPKVSVSLYTTKDWFDTRVKARDVIERYLARGPKWVGHLLERQLVGQRAIQLCLSVSSTNEPKVGQGLSLIQDEDKLTEFEQYVRVTKISSQIMQFYVNGEEESRKVLTLEISDPLRYTFEGITPHEYATQVVAKANLRDTRIADAATYYGISPMTAPASLNSTTVQVESLFTQLVPSSQSEVALTDLTAGSQSSVFLVGNTNKVLLTRSSTFSSSVNLYIGLPVMPKSLSLTIGSRVLTDTGQGVLKEGSTEVATIEYDKGLVKFNTAFGSYTGSCSAEFTPAVAATQIADTASISIVQENRGLVFAITLLPIPAPRTLIVSYMAQGKVYHLYDIGDGVLKGADAALGTGSINYVTGTVVLTLGTLPDADSEILFAWGKQVSAFTRANIAVAPSRFNITLSNQGVAPSSVTITWAIAGVNKTATDDGNGNITGDALGNINYSKGTISLTPTQLYQSGTSFTVAYTWGPPKERKFDMPVRGGDGRVSITLPNEGGGIQPKSLELVWNVDILDSKELGETQTIYHNDFDPPPQVWRRDPLVHAVDNGTGGLKKDDGSMVAGVEINYVARTITFNPEAQVSIPKPEFGWVTIGSERVPVGGSGIWWGSGFVSAGATQTKETRRWQLKSWAYVPTLATMPYDEKGYVIARWRPTADANAVTETFAIDAPRFDLTSGYVETIVQGSVAFKLGNYLYIDRAGVLYHSVDPKTGAGIQAGTIQYSTGLVSLSSWEPGAANSVTMLSLVTEMGVEPVDRMVFRAPVVPLRPGSVQVRAVPAAGNAGQQVTVQPDAQGRFNTAWVQGSVDYISGIVRLVFGQIITLTAADKTQAWYDPNQMFTDGGVEKYFRARPVYADSVRYNAVGYTYLPLDATTLGLDPVRLPFDGKVPIFRKSDVVVVHHTATTPFASNAGVGAMVDCGRTRLSYAKVFDANNTAIDPNMYSADLEAGVVTLKSTFVLGTNTAPLYVEHRIEDMAVLTDVQINGQLAMNKPLTHSYPAGAYVSSALVITDMQARVFGKFSQESWSNVWQATRIGNDIIAKYNDVQYPIEVTNAGAAQESWALIFTSSTQFRIVGKSLGQIGTGDINTVCSPINPATNVPYFTMQFQGWGLGWSAGNVLRFETAGANYPMWLARTVLQGAASAQSDKFQVQVRGSINR